MSWAEKVIRKARIDDPRAPDQLRLSASLSLELWLHEMQSMASRDDGGRKLAELRRLVMANDPGIGQIRARVLTLPPVALLAILRAAHRLSPAWIPTVSKDCDLSEWARSCPAPELLMGLRALLPQIELAQRDLHRRTNDSCFDEVRLVAYLASDLAHLAHLEVPLIIQDDAFRDLLHYIFQKVTVGKADTALRRFKAAFKAGSKPSKHRMKPARAARVFQQIQDRA